MKKTASFLAFAALTTTLLFTSCKKERNNTDEPSSTEMNTHADDQSKVADDMDAVTNDLNTALESNPDFAGARFMQTNNIVCGATIVADTANQQKRITITYAAANCPGNRQREGVVLITMPLGMRWKDAGATVTVNYQNLKITRKSDGKYITLNGTHELKNITGGLFRNLATNPITHTVTSNGMSISFSDGTQRNWQVARKREYTFNGGAVITITGLQSSNGITGVTEWGTDRFGRSFITSIQEPIIIKQDCNFRVTSGKVAHNRQAVSATVTFGLNSTGQPTGCPGTNSYFFKLEWTGPNGNTHSQLFPY